MSIQHIYFLDIETVTNDDYPRTDESLYLKKFKKAIDEKYTNDDDMCSVIQNHYRENGAMYAEFGRVICISIGKLHVDGKFYLKAITGRDEKELLKKFV